MLARQQYFEHVSEKLELRRLRIAHLSADRFHFLTSDGHVVRGGVADSHEEMVAVKSMPSSMTAIVIGWCASGM